MPSITSYAVAAGLVGLVQSACTEISGNYYCNPVTAVTYNDFGASGSYNRVTLMNDSTGACSFTPYSFSGTNAPFDEELSLHLRGPIQLKQFAYYTPSTSSSKVKREGHAHVHQHQNVHARDFSFEAPNEFARSAANPTTATGTTTTTVACPSSNQTTYTVNGDSFIIECGLDRAGNINMLYTANFATCIQGCAAYSGCVDVSYVSNGGGACYYKGSVLAPSYNSGVWGARLVSGSSSSSSAVAQSSTTKSASASSSTVVVVSSSSTPATSSTPTTSKSSTATTLSVSTIKSSSTSTTPTSTTIQTSSIATSASPTATGSSWTQQSYYSSTAGTANNVAFLNNMGGGTVSGVWSTNFGSSLSYASSDGTAAASSSQVLKDTTITGEVILFQGQKCGAENTDCGYYRPGTVAYHGFGGARKIILLEFAMPTGSSSNVPAIWLLNALIPRTQQYGSCTCWGNTNGCGEIDIFEVLTSDAANYMTSSIHGVQAGGDSDYFSRPTSATIKAAIVLDNGVLQISVLPSSFVFGSSLSASDYATIRGMTGLTDSVVTLA